VYHSVEAMGLEQVGNTVSVADVHVVVFEVAGFSHESIPTPGCVTRRAKELASHVVIHANHRMPLAIEVPHGLRPDQSA
jgi:hypothetical protein